MRTTPYPFPLMVRLRGPWAPPPPSHTPPPLPFTPLRKPWASFEVSSTAVGEGGWVDVGIGLRRRVRRGGSREGGGGWRGGEVQWGCSMGGPSPSVEVRRDPNSGNTDGPLWLTPGVLKRSSSLRRRTGPQTGDGSRTLETRDYDPSPTSVSDSRWRNWGSSTSRHGWSYGVGSDPVPTQS